MEIQIDEWVIKAIEKAYRKNGYDLPETTEGWSDIVTDLLKEKLIEDFGEEIMQ